MTYKSIRPERENNFGRHNRKSNSEFFDLKGHMRETRINRVLGKHQ